MSAERVVPTETATPGHDPAIRRCSRCLTDHPADPTLLHTADHAWWLCDACTESLLGTGRLRGWQAPTDG
jgi:hypothetical protein